MTLVMGVDSSTQSCKVVIRMPRPAPRALRARVAPRRHRGRSRGVVGRAAVRRSPTPAGSTTSRRSRSAASSTAWSCSTPRAASSAPPCCGTTPARRGAAARPDRRVRRRGARASAPGSCRSRRSRHEAALAARRRARERRARRRRRAAARLADLAPARLRSGGRVPARPGARRARHRPVGCLAAPATGTRDRRLRPRAARRGARPRRDPAARARPDEWVADARRTGALVGPGPATTPAPPSASAPAPGDVVVSIGTSGTVFAVTEQRTIDRRIGTVAGFADATGSFLPLVATLNAARVLDAIAGLLGRRPRRARPARARGRARVQPALVLVPYFEGERTPNLPDATASLSGMTLASTTRENLARAAVEGMLCGLADGLDARARARASPPSGCCSSAAPRRTRRCARSRRRCSTCRSRCPSRASTSPSAPPARRRGC